MLIGGTYTLYTYDISAEKPGIILLGLVKIILHGKDLHCADNFDRWKFAQCRLFCTEKIICKLGEGLEQIIWWRVTQPQLTAARGCCPEKPR